MDALLINHYSYIILILVLVLVPIPIPIPVPVPVPVPVLILILILIIIIIIIIIIKGSAVFPCCTMCTFGVSFQTEQLIVQSSEKKENWPIKHRLD